MTFSGTIIRGDDVEIITQVTEGDSGDVVDLTGITNAKFRLKETLSGDLILEKTLGSGVTVSGDATEGNLKIILTKAETILFKSKKHFFDIEIFDSTGLKSTVRNIDGSLGELTVLENL